MFGAKTAQLRIIGKVRCGNQSKDRAYQDLRCRDMCTEPIYRIPVIRLVSGLGHR
jgi:hypothetical protein